MAPAADPPSADPPLVDARLVGVRLGIDVGTVRVGVAASDPEGRLAFPVATVARGPQAAGEVARLASERGAVVVFVGLPLSFAGREGPSAIDARAFAVEVAERTGLVVRLIDERLSTVSAARALRAAGMSARRQRSVVDQQAAVVILGNALDTEKAGTTESVTEVVTHKGSHD
jgi:putative Holliday junction resolvase